MEGMNLINVLKKVKPTVLIGLSGCGGIFNGTKIELFWNSQKHWRDCYFWSDEVLTEMNNCPSPPIILPLSNPTSRSECSAEQAQRCTHGRAIFASGSPFDPVTIDGVNIASSQCNNRWEKATFFQDNFHPRWQTGCEIYKSKAHPLLFLFDITEEAYVGTFVSFFILFFTCPQLRVSIL